MKHIDMKQLYDNLSQKELQEIESQSQLLEKIWQKIGFNHALSANEVLKIVYGSDIEIPVNPVKIIEHFNIKLTEDETMQFEGLTQFDGYTLEIRYKPTNNNRDRFTLAHELGHIFLHFLEGKKFDFQDKAIRHGYNNENGVGGIQKELQPVIFKAAREEKSTSVLEREANIFAGELLIPKIKIDELKNILPKNHRYKQSNLCQYFQVSNGTMYHTMNYYGEWENMVKDDYTW
ncbi:MULTISPECIES: ImmA/IrrE family metallo-endopeptidase [Helicobacter]|uniref:IrrE N-terminal-like domain-containing protein n=1 Tax=Helicobacter bilis ATCC 43879 TaxID=613026 RepID=C3XGT5_9HELI|nr:MULTISPECIES: ImmA/IrrE family metallo-endopeptidase [Helicobacter]EEO24224.1 hypothetical protein HRAG_01281 [Helicobacter bilis ATCC 43879]